MLSKNFIEKLSDLTKIPVEKINEAITSENEIDLSTYEITHRINGQDETIKIDDLLTFTPLEHRQSMTNAGRTAVEMSIKEVRNELGLDFVGKTPKNLAEAAIELGKKEGKKEAGIEPTKKVQELETQITTLKKSLETAENERDEVKGMMTKTQQESSISKRLMSKIPKDIDLPFDVEELKSSFRTSHEIAEENGIIGVRVNGEFKRTKTGDILPVEDVFNEWLQPKLDFMKPIERRGRGAGSEQRQQTGDIDISSIKTPDDFYKYCDDNKISEGKQYEVLMKVHKENPNFVLE